MISVIIPAYNAVPYLKECLGSLPSEGVEIIVVDDGSVDGTADLVRESFPGVRLVCQENRGVSAARNAGIAVAQGKYVVFLDSDDRLLEDALGRLSVALEAGSWDIVVMRSFGSDSEKYPWARLFVDGTECTRNEVIRSGYVRGSVCGCAFRKGYLEDAGLSFPEGVPLSEDLVFFSACLAAGGRILFKDIPFYRVTERPGSASRQLDPGYLRRASLALAAARERIPDPALYVSTCRSIILAMIHKAALSGCSPSRLYKEAHLEAVLPLPTTAGVNHAFEVRLMNRCFPLYFRLKQFRDLCLLP